MVDGRHGSGLKGLFLCGVLAVCQENDGGSGGGTGFRHNANFKSFSADLMELVHVMYSREVSYLLPYKWKHIFIVEYEHLLLQDLCISMPFWISTPRVLVLAQNIADSLLTGFMILATPVTRVQSWLDTGSVQFRFLPSYLSLASLLT